MIFLENKKIYFASDLHLGMYPLDDSLEREKRFVRWLDSVEESILELWLLGDIFDYWFEYAKVVPRGFTRFLGKLAHLSDKGIPIHIFTGNHDIWMFSYLQEEIGAEIHRTALITVLGDKTFYMAHGDGLSPNDKNYLRLQSIFKSKFLQWCYARIHPNASITFAQRWSKKSRYSKAFSSPYNGEDMEAQIQYSKDYLKENPNIDFFVYGHRHVPYNVEIRKDKYAICLGDWIVNFSHGEFDGETFTIHTGK